MQIDGKFSTTKKCGTLKALLRLSCRFFVIRVSGRYSKIILLTFLVFPFPSQVRRNRKPLSSLLPPLTSHGDALHRPPVPRTPIVFLMARTKKTLIPPSEDPEVQKLKEEWKNLDRFTKGDRLVSPRRRFTWAQLASELPCEIKKLRDFQVLSTISRLDRIASKKIGTKKLLARVRKNHKTLLRWEKQVTGPDSRKINNRLAKVVADWLRDKPSRCSLGLLFPIRSRGPLLLRGFGRIRTFDVGRYGI